jgi:hypothetical protein
LAHRNSGGQRLGELQELNCSAHGTITWCEDAQAKKGRGVGVLASDGHYGLSNMFKYQMRIRLILLHPVIVPHIVIFFHLALFALFVFLRLVFFHLVLTHVIVLHLILLRLILFHVVVGLRKRS